MTGLTMGPLGSGTLLSPNELQAMLVAIASERLGLDRASSNSLVKSLRVVEREVGRCDGCSSDCGRGAITGSALLAFLPDAHALGWRQIHGLPGLDVEGGVPGVEILDGVGAPLCGGVAVGDYFVAQRGVADFAAPALHVA
jgi:hypothetical protein